ncbi:hypothetical protein HW115_17480 [Verrucomicrobiaceae bacterium N1E253]|uniref:Uncharacterized protein n=1 Tax=Oceaniferula marina TaxID=2748318 RepID=A0A851GT28_9BACT|nr:hypothetical protein [Oceaniferula marina]NWK57414.1 hypothetical protein [Oceaniferula marina]
MKIVRLFSLLVLALPATTSAELENEIQWGVEAVTGYRSDYIYRGFELAESTLDFQLEAEVALSDTLALNIGGWYATETGSGDFDEVAGFLKLHHQTTEHLTLGASATYRDFNNSLFEEGVDLGLTATWNFCRDFGITLGGYYDTGAEGWYGNLESYWTKPVSDKAFFALKTGISAVDSYYDRDGFNDVYARASLTYNISDTVSVTPFIGGSALLDSDDIGDDTAFGGIWFEVRF